jgi:phospholipid/cholesterol/gamma-HCH transport system substrate-binding protein
VFKRFDPIARSLQKIGDAVAVRHANVEHAIHNFQLLLTALGGKDKQLSQLVDASNAVFAAFSRQDENVQATLRELPGTLKQTNQGLGKLTSAARVLGPTLAKLEPFAKALGPAQRQTRPFLEATEPIIKNEIRPFTREVLPVINEIQPDIQALDESFPALSTSFGVLNEFLNELAYNPGSNQPGFLFYLNWLGHNINSVLSNADANGPLGHGLLFIPCPQLFTLQGVEEVNAPLKAVIQLLHSPRAAINQCPAPTGGGISSLSLAGRVFGHNLQSTYGLGGTP